MNLLNGLQVAQQPDGTRNVYQGLQFPEKKSPWDTEVNQWEQQFGETVKNPELYTLPASNVWARPPWN